jgi:hypothetical protein
MNKSKILWLIIGIIIFILICVGIYFLIRNKQNFTLNKNIKGKKEKKESKHLEQIKMRQIQHKKNRLNSLLRAAYINEEKQVDKENVQNTIIGNCYFLPDVNFAKLNFPQPKNSIFKDQIYIYSNPIAKSGETLIKTFSNDNNLIQRIDLNDIENNFSFKNTITDIIVGISNKVSLNEEMPTRVVNVKKTLNDILNTNTEPDYLLNNLNNNFCSYNFDTNKKTFNIYMLSELYSNENNINSKFLDELVELVYSKPINFKRDDVNNPSGPIYNYISRDVNQGQNIPNNIHIDEQDFLPYIEFMKKWGSHFIDNVTFGKSVMVWEAFNKDLSDKYNIDYMKRIDLCRSECSKFPNPDKCINNIKETFEFFDSTPYPSYSNINIDDILKGLDDELINNPNFTPINLKNSLDNVKINSKDCQVGEWSPWSQCSVNCGGGEQSRERKIIQEQQYGGETCPPLAETRSCNTNPCPINCEVGEWTNWEDCNVQCGGGTHTRSRPIVVQPKYGGNECPPLTDSESCNTNPCPIDCKVSDWSDWNKCDQDCDGGKQTRTRTVITDSAYGGITCPPLSETQDCNTQPCVNCDSNFCSNTDYSISHNNYCLKENCTYPYVLSEDNGTPFCKLNLDDSMKNLLEEIKRPQTDPTPHKDMDYVKKLFQIKQSLFSGNNIAGYSGSEIDDAKKLPTIKTINIIGGTNDLKQNILSIQDGIVNLNNDNLMKFMTNTENDKPIIYSYKAIWELIKELYLSNCLSDNINEKYIYSLKQLQYTCKARVTDVNFINEMKDKYKNLFANPNLPVEVIFETSKLAIDILQNYDTQYLDIEKFNFSLTNDKQLMLGRVSTPLHCESMVLSGSFKLNNESYFGNGYNIKNLIQKINSDKNSFFNSFHEYTNYNYVLVFGITTEKLEDIKVSMIILDNNDNIIDLKFNINSLIDPNVFYNLSFKNSENSKDMQNNIQIDIKFSLSIPNNWEKNNYKTFDYTNTSLQYFEGSLILYKDKILLLNNPEQTYGNKITSRQFYIPNNLTQMTNLSFQTSNGNVVIGKVSNSGKLKSVRLRCILNKYNTENTDTKIFLRIGQNFKQTINITPSSEYLQDGNIVNIINTNENKDIYLGNSTDNNIKCDDKNQQNKWILNKINNDSNFISDGDIITILNTDKSLQLLSNCSNKTTYEREFQICESTIPLNQEDFDKCVGEHKSNNAEKIQKALSRGDFAEVNKIGIQGQNYCKQQGVKGPCNKTNSDSCDKNMQTFCKDDNKCYKNCNYNYHMENENDQNCSINCVSNDTPLKLGFAGLNVNAKWKISKINKNGDNKIKKNEMIMLTSLDDNCKKYSFLSTDSSSNGVLSNYKEEDIYNKSIPTGKIWAITGVMGGQHQCWNVNWQNQGWVPCARNIPTKPGLIAGIADLNHDIRGPDAGIYVKYELVDINSETPILTSLKTGQSHPDYMTLCPGNGFKMMPGCTYGHPEGAAIISQTHGTKGACDHYQAGCAYYTPANKAKTYINSIAVTETGNRGAITNLSVQLPGSENTFTLSNVGSLEDLHKSCGDDYALYVVFSTNTMPNKSAPLEVNYLLKGCYNNANDLLINSVDKGPCENSYQCMIIANNENKNAFKVSNNRCFIGDSVNTNYQPKAKFCESSSVNDLVFEKGNYKYVNKGCYNDKEDRAVPNNRGVVTNIQQCADMAEINNENVFAVQGNGTCFTGNDINKATSYGRTNYDKCSINGDYLGGGWTNIVYNKVDANVTQSPQDETVRSSQWKMNILEEREFTLIIDDIQNIILNDNDEISISSSARDFTISNTDISLEVLSPSFISWYGEEYFSHPTWFQLETSSVFSYSYMVNKNIDVLLDTGADIYINSNELYKYFPNKNVSTFSPFPTFSIEQFNLEFWGYTNKNETTNYDIFNKYCDRDVVRTFAATGKRSVIKSDSNGNMEPVKNEDGINYYDVIYTDDDDPNNPKNVIELYVPQGAISIAHDSCKLIQGAYNLEAAYIFSSKTFCPYTNVDRNGVIQKIIPTLNQKITTYGCWNKASGCQNDSDCSGITTDEHIDHTEASYGRGVGWIPDVHCPNRSCSNQQGIGFASWCDNSPTWPWDLNICGSDKDCGKNGEQWGGFCYPKCRDGYHNSACCICSRNSDVDHDEYDRVKFCNQEQGLFHEVDSSIILGDPTQYRTINKKPDSINADGTGKTGQYSCAADNARVNNLNEVIRAVPQVGEEGAPCKCQNPYTIPGKKNEPSTAVWNILPDRLIWSQKT